MPDKDVVIYSPEEVSKLLAHAEPELVPYLALGAFAGLRRAELMRLDWKNLDFSMNHIRIAGNIAKTGSKRLIPMAPNLREWLLPYAQGQGRIVPEEKGFQPFIDRVCKRSGWYGKPTVYAIPMPATGRRKP